MNNQQTESVTAQQRDEYKVGPGCPPREHQWKKGQSGNPAGSPKAKTNLYKHIGKYSAMTDAEIAQLDHESMTQSQKAALKIVQDMAAGNHTGAEGMARYIVDREEGKVPDRHVLGKDDTWASYQAWLAAPTPPQVVMFSETKQIAAVDREQSEIDDKGCDSR